jgi:hypothetical protein
MGRREPPNDFRGRRALGRSEFGVNFALIHCELSDRDSVGKDSTRDAGRSE